MHCMTYPKSFQLDVKALNAALFEGRADSYFGYGEVGVEVVDAGLLYVPTGEIIAAEPFLYDPASVRWTSLPLPFQRRVPPGRYPVKLVVCITSDGDQRVGLAHLVLSDVTPTHWEIGSFAGLPAGDAPGFPRPQHWQVGKVTDFGDTPGIPVYGVDGGFGAFYDRAAIKPILEVGERDDYMSFLTAARPTYRPTYEWANIRLGDDVNLVLFSSGAGDGSYPTYVGLDENDHPVCFVTDFQMFDILREDWGGRYK